MKIPYRKLQTVLQYGLLTAFVLVVGYNVNQISFRVSEALS